MTRSRPNADSPESNNTPISSCKITDEMIVFIVELLLKISREPVTAYIIKGRFLSREEMLVEMSISA